MPSRSLLPTLLLIVVLPMFACQFLAPTSETCGVDLPGTGWAQHRQGDEVAFTQDGVDWTAKVDCRDGHLEEGQPVRPERAREIIIPVENTTYRLITADSGISMNEYRGNGSHVRIDDADSYYVAVLEALPGNLGSSMVRFFMAGEMDQGLVH